MATGLDYLNMARGQPQVDTSSFLGDVYDIGRKGQEFDAGRRREQTIADIGLGYQQGGVQGARDAAFRGGEVETGLALDRGQREQVKQHLMTLQDLAAKAEQATGPGQWDQTLQMYEQQGIKIPDTYRGPNGRLLAQTHALDTMEKIKRELQTLQVQGQRTSNALGEVKLREAQDPNVVYDRRAGAADKYGGDSMSPRERNEFIMTGDFPRSGAAQRNISAEVQAREQEAHRLGLQPGTPAYQSYVLTGKMGRDEPMTAGERKAIFEAEDALPEIESTVAALERAKQLNGKIFTGLTAGARGYLGTRAPLPGVVGPMMGGSEAAKATAEWDQIMSEESIKRMSATLKGASTDREMGEFQRIVADKTAPPEQRARAIERMLVAAKRKQAIASERLNQIRGGTYFKPGGGQSTAPDNGAGGDQPMRKVIGDKSYVKIDGQWYQE